MLRLPPTTIALIASEVRAYEEGRQARCHLSQPDNESISLLELESESLASKSPSASSNKKIGASNSTSFRDSPTLPLDPSVLKNQRYNDLVEDLGNLEPGLNIGLEGISLPNSLKNNQPQDIGHASHGPSLMPETPWPGIEDLDAQPLPTEVSEAHRIEMGLRTQRPCKHSEMDIYLNMAFSTTDSQGIISRSPFSMPRLSSPATPSQRRISGARGSPETPPRSSSSQTGRQQPTPSSDTSDRSDGRHRRPPIVLLGPPGSRSHTAMRSSQIEGPSNAHNSTTATARLSSSVQLDGNHDFRIYNDELPAADQPQTPQNLPDARLRGRLGGAFTAPVTGVAMVQASAMATARAAIAIVTPTPSNRAELAQREPSPPGLETPGFRGLYGGLENTDDAVLYQTGSVLASGGSRLLRARGDQERH